MVSIYLACKVQAPWLTPPSDTRYAQRVCIVEFKLWPRWLTCSSTAALRPYGGGKLTVSSEKPQPRQRIKNTFYTHNHCCTHLPRFTAFICLTKGFTREQLQQRSNHPLISKKSKQILATNPLFYSRPDFPFPKPTHKNSNPRPTTPLRFPIGPSLTRSLPREGGKYICSMIGICSDEVIIVNEKKREKERERETFMYPQNSKERPPPKRDIFFI